MANRKITVVGDGAEEPLSPEEEHKIEVKIDKMLDPNQPDNAAAEEPAAADTVIEGLEPKADEIAAAAAAAESQLEASQKPANKAAKKPASKPKITKIITKFADDEPEETVESKAIEAPAEQPTEDIPQTAPPLPKKSGKKITIIDHADTEPVPQTDSEPSAEEASDSKVEPAGETTKPTSVPVITKFAPEESEEPEETTAESTEPTDSAEPAEPTEEPAAVDTLPIPEPEESTEPEPTEETPEPEAPKTPTRTGKTIKPLTEPTELDPVQKSALSAQASMQGSIIPLRKPEPAASDDIADDLTPAATADPLSAEDAAIAHAFDTKQPARGARLSKVFNRTLLKIVVIVLVLGAIGWGVAMPTVRSRLSHAIHSLHTSKPATSSSTSKSTTPNTAAAVPEVYVAKQNGTFNVYKASLSGQNPKLLLAGTGTEQSDKLALAPNALSISTALVSNRTANVQTLTIIDVASGKSDVIDTSASIHLIDWFGDRIVYVLSKTNTATGDVNRDQLVSYDVKTKQRLLLDHAAYFNDIVSAQGRVYYTTASASASASASGTLEFVSIPPDNSTKQVLLTTEVWRIYRTDYNHLVLGTASTWYSYKIGDAKPTTINNAYTGSSRLYIDSPDAKHSLWVDTTGGQNALMVYDVASGKDSLLTRQANLGYPVRWLGNTTVAFRVQSPTETADYQVGLQGGTPTKITDVAAVPGIALWY